MRLSSEKNGGWSKGGQKVFCDPCFPEPSPGSFSRQHRSDISWFSVPLGVLSINQDAFLAIDDTHNNIYCTIYCKSFFRGSNICDGLLEAVLTHHISFTHVFFVDV